MANVKLKRKPVEAKLSELRGNISATAQHFGVARNSLYAFIERDGLQGVLADARETLVDSAESALLNAVMRGEAWAVCFTLKTQGKARGYVETVRNEVSGLDGGAIQVESFNYAAAIAGIAPRPVADSSAPSQDEGRSDGQTVGQNDDGS